MTAVNGDPAPGADLGGLAALPGLETVAGQIADLIAVLRAEQARRRAGIEIRRSAWKNLVFTGGPGSGKSRAARALASLYKDLAAATAVVGLGPDSRAWADVAGTKLSSE